MNSDKFDLKLAAQIIIFGLVVQSVDPLFVDIPDLTYFDDRPQA
jgi:hypothetical protein